MGYGLLDLGKRFAAPGLSVLISKYVCHLNQLIGEVMERALALESDRPKVSLSLATSWLGELGKVI